MANDVKSQIESIRESLKNLSNDAICLRRSLDIPNKGNAIMDALRSIKGNASRMHSEGKKINGEEDFLPWLIQRIEMLEKGLGDGIQEQDGTRWNSWDMK